MTDVEIEAGMGAGSPILSINKLTKNYGNRPALRDVTFDVNEGDIFGFLGPNGAGKTTTFSILADLVRPTSGDVRIFGSPHRNRLAVRPHIGMLIETPSFYEYLSGRRNLELLARLHPHPDAVAPRSVDQVLDLVGLLPRASDKVGKYSHGMKQRLGIAQALLGKPRLLLLDEPTNGLDPEGSAATWALLRHLASERITIVVSSHLLHEVEESCNRIAVINEGITVACDEIRRLLFFSKEDTLLVFDDVARRVAAESVLRKRDSVDILMIGNEPVGNWGSTRESLPISAGTDDDHVIRIRVQQGETTAVIEELVSRGHGPRAAIPQRKTLRQFFLELTRRQPDRPLMR